MRSNAGPTMLLSCVVALAAVCSDAFGADKPAQRIDATTADVPVWPHPPELARIRFDRSIRGASDWGLARGWWGRMVDSITGRHETQFVRPTGVAQCNGILYVADPGAQSLVAFDAARHKERHITRAGDASLVSPVAVACGPAGTVYLADSFLRKVQQFDRDGILVRAIAHDDLQRPSSVAFDPARQRLYVGDSRSHVIHVFDGQGRKVATIGSLGSGPGQFNSPTHLALAPDGSIVVTDALNFRVQVLGNGGEYRYQLGKIGDGAGSFSSPKGVAVDHGGHLYVADTMFDAIQVFDADGRLLLGFGSQGKDAGQFWMPNGLTIDDGDRLFVADAYNRRIQVFQILAPPDAAGVEERGSAP